MIPLSFHFTALASRKVFLVHVLFYVWWITKLHCTGAKRDTDKYCFILIFNLLFLFGRKVLILETAHGI